LRGFAFTSPLCYVPGPNYIFDSMINNGESDYNKAIGASLIDAKNDAQATSFFYWNFETLLFQSKGEAAFMGYGDQSNELKR
jgi:hypothetical protein